jgi:hypothetical protein
MLSALLNTRRKIDAYCIVCKVGWSISESERQAIQSHECSAPDASGS